MDLKDCFISYSHKDEKQVLDIVNKLKSKGYTILMDEMFSAGENWKEKAYEYVLSTKCTIVFISDNSIISKPVLTEMEEAKDESERDNYHYFAVLLDNEPIGDKYRKIKKIADDVKDIRIASNIYKLLPDENIYILNDSNVIDTICDSLTKYNILPSAEKTENKIEKIEKNTEKVKINTEKIEPKTEKKEDNEDLKLGNKYYDLKDYKKAFEYYLKAANQGNADAQVNLGRLYNNGYGVPRDIKKAYEYFVKAADQGHSDAQWILGNMLYIAARVYNYPIEGSTKKALEYLEKSANQGNRNGQYILAQYYVNGIKNYLEINHEKAVKLYSEAVKQGHLDAHCGLAFLYITGQGVPQDYDKAFDLLIKTINLGNAKAYSLLTDFLCEKAPDYWGKTINFITKKANQGSVKALSELGSSYYYGKGVPKDYEKAIYYYEKAAEKGDGIALSNLGCIYEYGNGVPKDYEKAAYYYGKAADQRVVGAKKSLDRLYESGKIKLKK